MAAAVPFFLQALMLGYSARLATKSRRYSSLVRHLFRLPTGRHFISLNYDLPLDIQLAQRFKLDTLDDYLGTDEDWSLIKPHGSAAWYVPQTQEINPGSPPRDFTPEPGPIMAAKLGNGSVPSISKIRGLARPRDRMIELAAAGATGHESPSWSYPAIASSGDVRAVSRRARAALPTSRP